MIINDRPYRVDGEIGRFTFQTHKIFDGKDIDFNSAVDLFQAIGSKEYYRTIGFKDIAMIFGTTEDSYRKAAESINRFRYQQNGDGTPYRTLRDTTEREGSQVLDYMEIKSERIFKKFGFSSDGQYKTDGHIDSDALPVVIPTAQVSKQVKDLQPPFDDLDVMNNPVKFESPENTVNIAIDDVTPKRQKDNRVKGGCDEPRKRKYVHDTIIRIDFQKKKYTLSALGINTALKYLIAFLLNNDLKDKRFQFFTDGHKTLNQSIFKAFSWKLNLGLILDWYHLTKKCKEQLSMALKGREIRNEVLADLMPLLWHGLTLQAIDLLNALSEDKIRNKGKFEKLIAYLERNIEHIPCYAVRKKLGLCNSSSIGEKMNDIIVSKRQKHNGMAWSRNGSAALAALTSLKRNGEQLFWFERKKVKFKLAA